jgi:Reverse transcriptase (RNA-dependent DNA polymerase)
MNVSHGYWNIILAKESRYLTAVRTVIGLYQYCRLATGVKNASALFQRHMNRLLGDCKYEDATPYQDDVNIANETAAEHVVSVAKVLDRLEMERMKLKLAKCSVGLENDRLRLWGLR